MSTCSYAHKALCDPMARLLDRRLPYGDLGKTAILIVTSLEKLLNLQNALYKAPPHNIFSFYVKREIKGEWRKRIHF